MIKFVHMKNDLYSQIQKALKASSEILAAYVIGSTVSKRFTSESDFDLVVVAQNREAVGNDKVYELIRDIKFPRNLDLSVVDKSSSPIFLYQTVAKGERIYVKEKSQADNFEAFVLHNYYDTSHLRNIYDKHLREKLSSYAD